MLPQNVQLVGTGVTGATPTVFPIFDFSGGGNPLGIPIIPLQVFFPNCNGIPVGAANFLSDGTTGWNAARGATVFRTAVVTAAGPTVVWAPAPTFFFRLLAWRMSVAGTLAAAGTLAIELLDDVTVIANAGANVGDTYPATDSQIGADYGQVGILAANAGNALSVSLSDAMTNGGVFVEVWGTEET